jgi:protein-S-isoprenylcysteine O-methyltransferase Ste14
MTTPSRRDDSYGSWTRVETAPTAHHPLALDNTVASWGVPILRLLFKTIVSSNLGRQIMASEPSPAPKCTAMRDRYLDILGKLAIATLFGLIAVAQVIKIYKFVANWSATTMDYKVLHFASSLAGFIFVAMIVAMTVVRLRPLRKAPGIQPRLSALFGAFLSMSLVLLPKPSLPPAWQVLSIVLLLVGSALSFYVLSRLGRSFSVMAEARQLVTDGPYAIVRHPLYLCEEIAIIGAMLAHLSPSAVVIVAVQWLFQLKRMAHEERVLHAAFPDYAAYAAATPKLFPRMPRRPRAVQTSEFAAL